MENKRTEELRKYKNTIKSKLMASIAMLLVSSILLSSTTYAWFILSTAPEVTGMATTVGSNGSLEIALLNNETAQDMYTISAGVGDSYANRVVTEANETWGNILELGDASYGLGKVTLYPAALNMQDNGTSLVNLYSPLSIPEYGTDGRVAQLSAEQIVSGKYEAESNGFAGAEADFGVRAIGTAESVDPVAKALREAKSFYRTQMSNAVSAATNALNGTGGANAQAVTKLLVAGVLEKYPDEGYSIVVTAGDKAALGQMINGLNTSVTYIENALKLYVVGYEAAKNNRVVSDANMSLSDYSYMSSYAEKLSALKATIASAQEKYAAAQADEVNNSYNDVLAILVDQTGAYVGDKLISSLGKSDVVSLLSGAQINIRKGLLADVADFVNNYKSDPYSFAVTEVDSGDEMQANGAVMTAYPNDGVNAYLPYLQTNETDGLNNLQTQDNATGATVITTQYGYVIDMAFRASTATNLMLTPAVARVDGETATQGSGSTFTLNSGDVADLRGLRVVFVDATYNIIGVAALDTTDVADGQTEFALHMYDWSVNGNGSLMLGDPKGDDTVMALEAGVPTKLSVMVYLDGQNVSSSMAGANGMLNLQFASSATLSPMDYSNWITSTGNENQPAESQPATEAPNP